MKKLFIFSIMLGSIAIFAPSADATTTSSIGSAPEVQTWRDRQRNWNRGRTRTVIRTRIVTIGFRRYRETIRVMYLPNGRTRTTVISRVRIR